MFFFFSSRRRHTRLQGDWSSDVCSSDLRIEAIAAIRRLERFDLQFVEQPCATLEELAEVRRRVSAPIAADESVATVADVLRAAELEACDVVNVKLAASGGFSAAREAVDAAQEHNMA